MEHLAIMKKGSGFLEKIISGEKIIESRWYQTKRTPWDKLAPGEVIFFKNSGEPVTVRAVIDRVIQLDKLTSNKIKGILTEFGKDIGVESSEEFIKTIKNKKYCILIFLDKVELVEPFLIDKTGFGMMSAWITVKNINDIKRGLRN